MKNALAKILGPIGRLPLKRAAGVHVLDGHAHVAVAARTLLSYEVVGTLAAPLDGRRPGQVIGELLVQARQQFGPYATITAGIPSNDVYFEAKPMNRGAAPEQYQTPEALAAILPAALSPNTLLVNMQPVFINATYHFLITACKRTVVYNGIQTFAEAHARASRFEPAPWALLRQSFLHEEAGAADQLQMRMLVGPRRCIGYLLQGERPLAWFSAPLNNPETRESGLLSTIRSMENHARAMHQTALDAIKVQGLDDDSATSLSLACGLAVETMPGPQLDGGTMATGLAVAGLDPGYSAPNLADKLQAPDTLWALLNHFEAGMVALAVFIMALALVVTESDLRRRLRSVSTTTDQYKPARGKSGAQLKKMRDEAKDVADKTAAFLDRRNHWASTLIAVAHVVPAHSRLKGLTLTQGQKPNDRQLQLRCLAPEERPVYNNFKEHPWLGAMYATVELAGLVRSGGSALRSFAIEAQGTGPVVTAVTPTGCVDDPAAPHPSPGASPAPAASPAPSPRAPSPAPKGGR